MFVFEDKFGGANLGKFFGAVFGISLCYVNTVNIRTCLTNRLNKI